MYPQNEQKTTCGIVMPISSIDGCDVGHWVDVRDIISQSIENAGFTPNLVSNADEVGIIHKRIIQNLYENPIVVCDVSGKNPNVMFELGMRLAFDKPTIVVKDDRTSYSFDTSPIEHLEYPRDLRFTRIVDFKSLLADKIKATFEKASSDPNYTTFLKHFGDFKIAKIDQKEVPGQEFILDELRDIRRSLSAISSKEIRADSLSIANQLNFSSSLFFDIPLNDVLAVEIAKIIRGILEVDESSFFRTDDGIYFHFTHRKRVYPTELRSLENAIRSLNIANLGKVLFIGQGGIGQSGHHTLILNVTA